MRATRISDWPTGLMSKARRTMRVAALAGTSGSTRGIPSAVKRTLFPLAVRHVTRDARAAHEPLAER